MRAKILAALIFCAAVAPARAESWTAAHTAVASFYGCKFVSRTGSD